MWIFLDESTDVEEEKDEDNEQNGLFNSDSESMDTTDDTVKPRLTSSGYHLFDCPNPLCIKTFRRQHNLDHHLTTGNHLFKPTRRPLLDTSKLLFQEKLESDTAQATISLQHFNAVAASSAVATFERGQGWALFKPKPKMMFTPEQKTFLTSLYDEGIVGKRMSPVTAAEVRLSDEHMKRSDTNTIHD